MMNMVDADDFIILHMIMMIIDVDDFALDYDDD